MIIALLIGRKGSMSVPGKNSCNILGKPMAWYPMNAACNSSLVDATYLSTDDDELMDIALSLGVKVIKRPKYLCDNMALAEDAYKHALGEIEKEIDVDLLVTLFCNAATVTSDLIDEGIGIMLRNDDLDSVTTVSKFNMYNPSRAKRINEDGLIEPLLKIDESKVTCDRDCMGDVWFTNCSLFVIKPENFKNSNGQIPQKWMGEKVYPLKQDIGFDVDEEWQIPILQWWLEKYYNLDN